MIWVDGRIVADDQLSISVLDRTFEHGLGLFETLRTWNNIPRLLKRHLARLASSARELRIPLDPQLLPDESSVRALRDACQIEGDARLRITLSGGLDELHGSTLWMRASGLGRQAREAVRIGDVVEVAFDRLDQHKTLNYWRRRLAFESAQASGLSEALIATPDGNIWEACRSNLFFVQEGTLVTPGPAGSGPFRAGIFRELILECAARLRMDVDESHVSLDRLRSDTTSEAFLTNSVRGIQPVGALPQRQLPRGMGPWTQRLQDAVIDTLLGGGERAI